jgi:hypothetical protein
MPASHHTELRVRKKATELKLDLQVIRPANKINRYEFRKGGKLLGRRIGAADAMEYLEEYEEEGET